MPNRRRPNNQERNNQLRQQRQKVLKARAKREARGEVAYVPAPFRANNKKKKS